jgi:hypothetical protein
MTVTKSVMLPAENSFISVPQSATPAATGKTEQMIGAAHSVQDDSELGAVADEVSRQKAFQL